MVKKYKNTSTKTHHRIMLFYMSNGMSNKTRLNLVLWNCITTEYDHTVFAINELKMLL